VSASASTFFWSRRREETFRGCLRKYWFEYRAATLERDPARRHTVMPLRRLLDRNRWVEYRVRTCLRARSFDTPDAAVTALIATMRDDFKAARDGCYRDDPQRFGLFELEYRLNLPDHAWKQTSARAEQYVRNVLAGEPGRTLCGQSQAPAHFLLDGLVVRERPDFYDGAQAACLHFYPEPDLTQWTCQWLCVAARPDEPMELAVIVPADGAVETFCPDADRIAQVREAVMDSAEEMLFLEEDADSQAEEAHDCTEYSDTCKSCNFLRICPKWRGTT
jgi:hypothetical protein